MTKLEKLIQELCPEGVEYKEISEVTNYEQLFVCEMKYMCFCRLIHCFMKSVISTRTRKVFLTHFE